MIAISVLCLWVILLWLAAISPLFRFFMVVIGSLGGALILGSWFGMWLDEVIRDQDYE